MPPARATPGSLHSVFAAQRTKPFVSLSHFFILLKYNLGDAFQVWFIIIWARPFGSGFMLNYFMGDAFDPGYSGLVTLGFCFAKNQALRIPIAGLIRIE